MRQVLGIFVVFGLLGGCVMGCGGEGSRGGGSGGSGGSLNCGGGGTVGS